MTSHIRPSFGVWARLVSTAFMLAALLGTAQLGVVYGLRVLRLDREFAGGADNEWNVQLTWLVWFALLATLGGAGYAAGLARRLTGAAKIGTRISTSFAAAVGAAVGIAPLTIPHASKAVLGASFDPVLTAGLAIAGGIIAGLLLAPLTAARPPLSTNIWGLSAMVWILAAISLADTMRFPPVVDAHGSYYSPVRLGVLDISSLAPIDRASFTLPALALVAGFSFALIGRMRGGSRTLVGLSGGLGPTLIAIAYLVGGPGISRQVTDQADAYLGAMIAVVAGLMASALVAMPPRRRKAQDSGGIPRSASPVVPTQAPAPAQAAAPRPVAKHEDWVASLADR